MRFFWGMAAGFVFCLGYVLVAFPLRDSVSDEAGKEFAIRLNESLMAGYQIMPVVISLEAVERELHSDDVIVATKRLRGMTEFLRGLVKAYADRARDMEAELVRQGLDVKDSYYRYIEAEFRIEIEEFSERYKYLDMVAGSNEANETP